MRLVVEYDVRLVALQLILDGLESLDHSLPYKFYYTSIGKTIRIYGPRHNLDDIIVPGICILAYNNLYAYVNISPFEELEEYSEFEYGDPNFDTKLLNYVSMNVTTWTAWWDIFKEEEKELFL